MSANFASMAEPEPITAVSQQTIPLLGHLGSARNKHAHWGIKLTTLTGLSGYVHRFLVDGDKPSSDIALDRAEREDLGALGRSVLALLLGPEMPALRPQAAFPELVSYFRIAGAVSVVIDRAGAMAPGAP